MNRNFITRKELAGILEVTAETVRRRESDWGLREHRRMIGPRRMDYHRAGALMALRRAGIWPVYADSANGGNGA